MTPRLSDKERLILEMLTVQGEMYGLEMIGFDKRLKRGTVYVTLNRMIEKGYLTVRTAGTPEGEHGPPRRLYSPTGLGARVLHAIYCAELAFLELPA